MINGRTSEWLGLWYRLLDDPSIEPFKEPRDMAGVLADFRRDPGLLEKAFGPLPCGEKVLGRVKRCIGTESRHGGVYLVPDPVEASDDELRKLAADALERGGRCSGEEIPDCPIHVIRRPMTSKESVNAGYLVEDLEDFFMCFPFPPDSPEGEAARFLSETLYTLASSPEVKGYCLTPLFPEEVRSIDPYEPQFELWRRGAQAVSRWEDDSDALWVDIFVKPKTGSDHGGSTSGEVASPEKPKKRWWSFC